MKILIIRLSAMGDTIHTLPVAAALKKNIPGVELSWLVEPLSEPLLRNNPVINKVFVLRKDQWLSSLFTANGGNPGGLSQAWQLVQQLRSEKFDIAIDFQGLFKSGAFLALSNATRKIGLSDTREGAGLFAGEKVEVGDWFGADKHIVDRCLSVADYVLNSLRGTLAPLNSPRSLSPHTFSPTGGSSPANERESRAYTNIVEFPLPTPPAHTVEFARRLWSPRARPAKLSSTATTPFLRTAIVAGATWHTKMWPVPDWCQLLHALAESRNLELCLIGSPAEQTVNRQIRDTLKRRHPCLTITDLSGRTTLLDLIAIFDSCDLVIGADTGPLHLAAATGQPSVVGIYGSTPRVRNGPYGAKCFCVGLNLECQPCSSKKCSLGTIACMTDLTAEAVFKVVNEAIAAYISPEY